MREHYIKSNDYREREKENMVKRIGFKRFIDDIMHRRDRYRQFLGISFILLVSAAGTPKAVLYNLVCTARNIYHIRLATGFHS